LKLDRDTAEAIVRLSANPDFEKFLEWFDKVHKLFSEGAIMGWDEHYTPDVLRGRAQGLSMFKKEMEKAPEVTNRIQRVS